MSHEHYHKIEHEEHHHLAKDVRYNLTRLDQLMIKIESECALSDVAESMRTDIATARYHLSNVREIIDASK